jgi:hypothetical protein
VVKKELVKVLAYVRRRDAGESDEEIEASELAEETARAQAAVPGAAPGAVPKVSGPPSGQRRTAHRYGAGVCLS